MGSVLQRKCACGTHTPHGGECTECSKRKRADVQAKLQVNEAADIYEQEADRIAEQVLATDHQLPVQAPLRIQHLSRQPDGRADAASISVDQVLASPGSPMEPALRKDMEGRFGHDFSRVRVHADARASQSASELGAQAYAVGSDVVFGAGRFAPGTHEGRRLIAHELTHVVQQASVTGSNPVATSLQRRPGGTPPPPVKTAPPSDEAIRTLVDALDAFLTRGNDALARVSTDVRGYIAKYDGAYKAVTQRLSEAQKKEAENEKWKTALEFVVVVGIGLAGGELLGASFLLGKRVSNIIHSVAKAVEKSETVIELAKKEAEIVTVEALTPAESKTAFGLPAEVSDNLIARKYMDQLAQAWQGMSLAGLAVSHFDKLVIDVILAPTSAAGHDPHPKPPTGGRPSVVSPITNEDLSSLRQVMKQAESELQLFLGTVDTPVLKRTQEAIEIDLWIHWMSKSEANAKTALTDEEIAEHLREIGLYEVLGDFSVTSSDSSDLVHESKLQVDRLSQVGLVGVVALAPFWSLNRSHPLPGAVHVREDAYRAAGRREPAQADARPYVAIEWQEGSDLRAGDVVLLEDTSPDRSRLPYGHQDTYRAGGLLPKRLGPVLGVKASEHSDALAFLGANAASYPHFGSAVIGEGTDIAMSPDRARPFVSDVRAAVASIAAKPSLVMSESDEGILVSEADGTRLVLFTTYTSWGEARETLQRLGVPRVVAVVLKPSNTFEDFSDQGVVVIRQPNYFGQISAVRAALGRGPKVTVQ
ncbi:DUF4157 domain-containing protein [Rhodanobacter glycinis]|uniref:DUF4157 domain-containing protein n=2 Tax=Rhodanobacter glycinis TaxID=582702 RepID=A0A502CE06_9GAMM|nr:DUF4157 domain-containing protein [Rhodanobacter glycinis]TPG48542.1 DUF4157 domain-containing protein [Rhodanobacter glycinis]